MAPISKQQLTLCATTFSDVEEILLGEGDETGEEEGAAVVLNRWFPASKRDRKTISITT